MNRYPRAFARLRLTPGEWGRVAQDQASDSQAFRLKKAFPGAEVIARKNPHGKHDIFARYPLPSDKPHTAHTAPRFTNTEGATP